MGHTINKGTDLSLLTVFQVSYYALLVGVIGHELSVDLAEIIQFALG
jgi:hypothetical protein